MAERKVFNKYYAPDFDPSKLPRVKLSKNRQFNVRIMAPCNMKCNTCGCYIYKGKKFNSRQETVDGETYLDLRIYRFYIKCPQCMSEITFKTNLVEMDYDLENGATRNFQAVRLAEMEADRQEEAKLEEEKANPMIALERRTQDSRNEMDRLEALEELRDLNTRQANVNYDEVIKLTVEKEIQALKDQEDEDEAFVRSVFSKEEGPVMKRLREESGSDSDEDDTLHRISSPPDSTSATGLLSSDESSRLKKARLEEQKKPAVWQRSVGGIGSSKAGPLSGLVRLKKPAVAAVHRQASGSGTATAGMSSAIAAPPSGLGFLANQYGSSSSSEDEI